MQTFSANYTAALNASPKQLVDVYEVFATDYVPAPGAGFDPAAALYRFSAETLTWNGLAYRRVIKERDDINLQVSQEQNSVSLTFSNDDDSRYIATLAQTVKLEGCWLLVRTLAKLDGAFVTDDSRVWFTGKLGKPSTITKKEFSIEARQDFGDINVEAPTSKFTADDPTGRLPADPLFEGFRVIAVLGAFNYTQRTPSTSFLGRLLGKTKKKNTSGQFSSFDQTPLGDPVPEFFGSGQLQAIPIAWRDDGFFLHGLWVWCKGPIENITNIKTPGVNPNWNPAGPNTDGQYGPFQVMSHTGELGGTGSTPALDAYVPKVGGNAAEDQAFPGSGFFSLTAFTGLTLMQGGDNYQEVIDTPPTVIGLVTGRKVDLPDGTTAYAITGWTDNPVHITRFIFSSPRFVGINSGLLDDASNYLTSLICDAPVLNDSDDQHILISDGDLTVAGTAITRYRSTGLYTPNYFLYNYLGGVIAPQEHDGPYLAVDPGDLPIDPGSCPIGFHRDPVDGTCVADDPTTGPVAAQPLLQKRYTATFAIVDSVKISDLLYKTLFPAFKGFTRVNKQGRTGIFTELASDHTRIRTAVAVGDTAIQVLDVLPWKTGPNLLGGRILLGTTPSSAVSSLITSEVRDVSSASYSAAGNAVTLAASATGTSTATASGATLSGGSTTVRASGTITLGGAAAQGNIVRAIINNLTVSYVLTSVDTNQTAAAMLSTYINAITRLTEYIEAVWDPASPLVITIRAKHGTLNLSSPLLKVHSIGVVDPSTAPTVANTAGGSLEAGVYFVAYTNVTALGETCPTPTASATLTASHKIGISGLPAFPAGVTSRNFYLSMAPNSKTVRFVVTRADAADFTIDVLPDPEAALRPIQNTTAEELVRVAMSLATNSQDILPAWRPSTTVVLNDIYLPNNLNDHKYKATAVTTGITAAAAPAWPTAAGGTVVDGGVTWTEFGETVLGQTGLTRANIIADSYNWPMGSEQSTINQVKGTFVDRKNDFAKTPLLVNDRAHQLQMRGKVFPYEIDLQAVDNYNQAFRLLNAALAKLRDGDWFNTMGTGPGALAFGLEEGDLICSSDDSGGLVNVLTRIESLSISPNHEITVNRARLYSTDMFSDNAEKHTTAIPTNLRYTGLANSIVEFIDTFPIRDSDSLVPGFSVAVSRDLSIPGEWRGWDLYADYGDGYKWLAHGDSASLIGTCDTTLDTVTDVDVLDTVSSVDFTMKFGSDASIVGAPFVTVTEAEARANRYRNLFLIAGEYVQACTIVDHGNLSFTASDFLRGRFETDTPGYLMHGAGERIVFINGAEKFVAIDVSRLDLPFDYKAVTVNQDVAAAGSVPFTWTGNNIRGPLPSDLACLFDPISLDALTEWDGRNGLGEVYEIEIGNSDFSTIFRSNVVTPALALGDKLSFKFTTVSAAATETLLDAGFTIVTPAGILPDINFATAESITSAVVDRGLLVKFRTLAGYLAPRAFVLHPIDEAIDSVYALSWVRGAVTSFKDRDYTISPESTSNPGHLNITGDEYAIFLRADGVAEYHFNYGNQGSKPTLVSARPVKLGTPYKISVEMFEKNRSVGVTGCRWIRSNPEWRYIAQAQSDDGQALASGDLINARVRQRSFYPGGPSSAWLNSIDADFTRP